MINILFPVCPMPTYLQINYPCFINWLAYEPHPLFILLTIFNLIVVGCYSWLTLLATKAVMVRRSKFVVDWFEREEMRLWWRGDMEWRGGNWWLLFWERTRDELWSVLRNLGLGLEPLFILFGDFFNIIVSLFFN